MKKNIQRLFIILTVVITLGVTTDTSVVNEGNNSENEINCELDFKF